MSRARARFTESDVRRVLAGAKKAGVCVRVEITTDKITVFTGPSSEAVANPWDEVLGSAAPEQKRAS
jgi:hypothetical protein